MDIDSKNTGKSEAAKIGGLFIPGGLFIGMGIGFLTDNLVAGLFIGLGAGFVFYAASMFAKK